MGSNRTRNALLNLGFDTDFIKKIEQKSLNVSGLRGLSKSALLQYGFSAEESDLILAKVNRQPIPEDIIEELIKKSGGACCYCRDGNQTRPYQIHHIEEYSVSQNNEEDNLLLVCPTHHVIIHSKKIPREHQKQRRSEWEKLWGIAIEYQSKGIDFPLDGFEYVNYTVNGKISDIFSFAPPKPKMCIKLFQGALLDSTLKTLEKLNCIVLSGTSGSGKSTLSLAIAGSLDGFEVYRYTVSEKSSLENCREIQTFLSLCQKKIVLIIDDANTKLVGQQTEQIIRSANCNQKIIIVHTKSIVSNTENIGQRYHDNIISIIWQSIRNDIKANLLKYETEITDYLIANELNAFGTSQSIGNSKFDIRLKYAFENYLTETDSVWQFIYMLTSGIERLDNLHVKYFSKDRLDLILLLIAINQIGKIEKGTSKAEIKQLFQYHSKLKDEPMPSDEWFDKILIELIDGGIIKPKRDRFNLMHRKFAQSFIGHSYSKCKADTSELLNTVFLDNNRIHEIIIIWSWLRDSLARGYLQEWRQTLGTEDWKTIGEKAASHSLFCLYALCEYLPHSNDNTIHEILIDKAEIIANYINNPSVSTLYYFTSLSASISHNCPEIWDSILSKINKPYFAQQIKDSDPWIFEYLMFLFSAIHEKSPDWINELSTEFNQSDFNLIASKIYKGNISLLAKVIDFQRRYVANLKKSDLANYTDTICQLLKDCSIEKINFPVFYEGIVELLVYPELIDKITNALNPKKMAGEFVKLPPYCWENLVFLSEMASRGASTVIEDFLDEVNLDDLVNNVDRYDATDLSEFDDLVTQLTFAREKKRKEFAKALVSHVKFAAESIVKRYPQTDHHLLYAYSYLDSQLFNSICIELNLDPKLILEKDRSDSNIDYTSYINQVLEKEANEGEDYYLPAYKI